MATSDERLDRLEQRVLDLYAFKNRIESRLAADDAVVLNFLSEMEERNEARHREVLEIKEKQQLMYELLLRLVPSQSQQ